jgi:succinoglycan biosynthesis protein ExoM
VSRRHHISVCICTFKRPELLRRLLLKLEVQETEGLFDFSIVIVDNDRAESARQTVEAYAQKSKASITYHIEPEQNISRARNKAVENARGNFIGFLDDDEYPVAHWLLNHYKAMNQYSADGVLGPVLPQFERTPPKWVLKGNFFHRQTHATGHSLGWKNARTGNALLRREIFKEGSTWFDSAYGSGGEDRDFFRRKIEQGHVFVWCNEAPVYETVLPGRWKKSVMLKRALLRGKVNYDNAPSKPCALLKSIPAIMVYTLGLPFFLVLGQHIFMKYLVKDCDHLGNVFAALGIDLIGEKYVTG